MLYYTTYTCIILQYTIVCDIKLASLRQDLQRGAAPGHPLTTTITTTTNNTTK